MCWKQSKLYWRVLIACFMFVVLDCDAGTRYVRADPAIEMHNLQNQLGSYRHILFPSRDITLDVVIFNDSYHAKIYQQKAIKQVAARSIREIAEENNASVAVNGGFYTPDFQPAGLLIENGKTLTKTSHDPLLVSCIQVNKSGRILLEKKTSRCLSAADAMQTGPLLIERGDMSPSINVLQRSLIDIASYFSPKKRTILAQSSDKKLLVIVTSPMTLSEAANILKNSPFIFGVSKITTALNLDGGRSTGMYVRSKEMPFSVPEGRPVKTFVLFE